MRIYVGCGLTHAPESFKRFVENFKDKLRIIPGIEVLDFMGVVSGTPREVYHHDINVCVRGCDLLVAICDFPSIGLGWEMATQVSRGKPLLAFGHCGSKVTRLILDPGLPLYEFHRYRSFDDIYEMVSQKIAILV